MKTFKFFFTSCLLVFNFGCGFSLDDQSVQNPEVQRQNQRLEKLGQTVKGVYEGSLSHSDGKLYPIEIRLYSIDEIMGKDENGDIYTLPRLKGQIRFVNLVYPNEERQFDVKFDETGKFQMIFAPNRSNPESRDQAEESISGTWDNGSIAALWYSEGEIGSLKLERVSRQVPKIDEPERRLRLSRQFDNIIGLYQGELFTFGKPDVLYGILTVTIDYDLSSNSRGLVARFQVPNSVIFQNFQRVPMLWDPRTKVFDIDHIVGNARLTGSGTLTENQFILEKFRFAAEPFIYRPLTN